MRYDEDALCIVVEVRRRRATCDPGKAQMRDEKPPRRQAGQLRGRKTSVLGRSLQGRTWSRDGIDGGVWHGSRGWTGSRLEVLSLAESKSV